MAKINVVADTETGEMTVAINGNAVENFRDVSLSYYPPYSKNGTPMISASVSTYTVDDAGVRQYGQICAAQSEAGKTAAYMGGLPSEKFDGFVHNPNYNESSEKYAQATAAVAALFQRTK